MADVVGFRARNPVTGEIIVDITDRLTRVIGIVYSGSGPGSIQVPGFANGTGWVATLEQPEPSASQSELFSFPKGTISGTTLSWAFIPPTGATYTIVPCSLMYGVY